ncbi:MAG: alkaline phosphatase family protein [Kovacikia sp.]
MKTGDSQIGTIVNLITHSPLWSASGNSVIVITWDEDNNPGNKARIQGCCGFDPNSAANFGGGHIATIVITNHGPRGVVDPTPYNHYSLLRTTEDAFGIYEYLNEAGDTGKGVKPMTALLTK